MDVHEWFDSKKQLLYDMVDKMKKKDKEEIEFNDINLNYESSFEIFINFLKTLMYSNDYYSDIIINSLLNEDYLIYELIESFFNKAISNNHNIELKQIIYGDERNTITVNYNNFNEDIKKNV